jgi:hypothetical protein
MAALECIRASPPQPPTPAAVGAWTAPEVGDWLSVIRLGQFRALFRKRGVDGAVLLKLQHGDLFKMGIKDINAQTHLMQSISQFQDPPPPPPPPPCSVLAWTKEETMQVIANVSEVLL